MYEETQYQACSQILFNILILSIIIIILILIISYHNTNKSHNKNNDEIVTDNNASSRLNIEAARKSILDAEFPPLLRKYTFNTTDTGIFKDWNTSHISLGNMCNLITSGLQYAINHPDTADARLAILIAENFMIRYRDRLNQVPLNKIPWGTNWYQFSVSSTKMLAYYLLLPYTALKDIASSIILMIIENPKKSLGYNRDGPNSLYLSGPYLLAKNVLNEVDSVFNTPEYKYVLDFVALPTERIQGVDGLHMDHTYLFHSGTVAYSYLASLDSDTTNYFYELDTKIHTKPSVVWRNIKNIIYHPTISVSNMGIYGRLANLQLSHNTSSPFGIKVMPLQKYIRYFTKDYQFSMRGQVPWISYYEADEQNYSQAMYWTQYRNVHTKNSVPELQFPDAGFICNDNVTKLIDIPSTTTTTEAFKTPNAESFVLAYSQYGILWQKYSIDKFGPQTITELVVIDSKKNTITIDLIIENTQEGNNTVYYSSDVEVTIDDYRKKLKPLAVNKLQHFQTKFNLKLGTVKTSIVSETKALLPLILDNNISVTASDIYGLLNIKDSPKILCPKSEAYELDAYMDDDLGLFVFNKTLNQYIKE